MASRFVSFKRVEPDLSLTGEIPFNRNFDSTKNGMSIPTQIYARLLYLSYETNTLVQEVVDLRNFSDHLRKGASRCFIKVTFALFHVSQAYIYVFSMSSKYGMMAI